MPETSQPGRALPLLLGEGWRQVPARACGMRLLWESAGRLFASETDFAAIKDVGEIGRIDCPVAVDTGRGVAYRYACTDGQSLDYSEIRSFDLTAGNTSKAFRLGLNQWVVWMLRHLAKEDLLVAMVATHMPGEGVRIQHQLGLFDLKKGKRLFVPLPRDAFMPCDLHPGRREVLFSGAEGWQVVGLKGDRVAHLRQFKGIPEGRGGNIHPTRPLIALGGRGIALWNREHGNIQQVHPRGQQPVWSRDGEQLFFSESSSDLFVHRLAKAATERIFAVAGNPHAEVTQARPIALSPDGRYGALPILRRVRRALGEEGPTFAYHYSLVVLDFEQRELWQHTVRATNLAWG